LLHSLPKISLESHLVGLVLSQMWALDLCAFRGPAIAGPTGQADGLTMRYEKRSSMVLKFANTYDLNGLEAFASLPGQQRAGIDFLVMPELIDGGYARLHREAGPRSDVKVLVDRLASISRACQLHLIAGTLALPDSDRVVRNTCLVFSDGEMAGSFSKSHLYRPLGDDRFFAPLSPGSMVELKCGDRLVHIGVIVCYDLRFPETVRPWFKSGIDILIVPSRWPRIRDDQWCALLKARAIENQCFVVGVDSRDEEGGGSYTYGPEGREIFALGPDPQPNEPLWHTFDIDLDDIKRVKTRLDTRTDAWLL
jgi:omega-amidase